MEQQAYMTHSSHQKLQGQEDAIHVIVVAMGDIEI